MPLRTLALAVLASAACTRAEGGDRPAVVVRIPAHGTMPSVEAHLEVVPPLSQQQAKSLVTPLANAVYVAVKACPQVLPAAGKVGEIAVRYSVQGGKISPVDVDVAKSKGEQTPPCVAKNLEGREMAQAGSAAFTVKARVVLGAANP